MAMRTGRSGRRVPSRSRAPHAGTGGAAPVARERRGGPEKGTKPSDNGAGRAGAASGDPTRAQQRAAWEKRYAEAKERPELYPFTISGIPIKPL